MCVYIGMADMMGHFYSKKQHSRKFVDHPEPKIILPEKLCSKRKFRSKI